MTKVLNSKKASSNLLCRTHIEALKPAPVAGFIFSNSNRVNTVSKSCQYFAPVIIRSDHGWYIKYKYLIPDEVRFLYSDKKWYTFRLKLDINRRKGQQREEYAEYLRSEIEKSLKEGYNPFMPELERLNKEKFNLPEVTAGATCKEAMQSFLEKWNNKGLDSSSYRKYKKSIARLSDWLYKTGLIAEPIASIKSLHMEAFFDDGRKNGGWSNREHNNTIGFVSTFFNYCRRMEWILTNPVNGVKKLKTNIQKHRYYDQATLKKLFKVMEVMDPFCLVAFKTIYYSCVRADKELQGLKVGNIDFENSRILIESTGAKGGRARYIPMDDNLKELLEQYGVRNFPPEYYVFGIKGKPAPKPFAHTFFSKRFKKVRDAAGLPSDFTMYGAKHTRVVDLKIAGATDAEIMQMTGHSDFTAYSKYMRDLGLTADLSKINKISRKI